MITTHMPLRVAGKVDAEGGHMAGCEPMCWKKREANFCPLSAQL